jgi:DNA-binding CsgD family transcriptional regulator
MISDRLDDARLLDLVGDIQGLLDLDEFCEGLLAALRRTIPADWVALNEFVVPGEVWGVVVPPISEETLAMFVRYGHQNPLVRQVQERQDGRAYRWSDVVSPEELHALDLYREFYAQLGAEYQMAFTLPHTPPRVLGVALTRCESDFSDGERDFLNRARPFLIQGYRNAVEHTGLRRAAAGGSLIAGLRDAGLTPREADVMRLVALGRSNADAAEALGLSVRTVHKHVERAFAKLGVHSRSQAAAAAWERAGATPAAG